MSTFSLFVSAIERYFEPDQAHLEHLLIVSLFEIVLNFMGVKLFCESVEKTAPHRSKPSLNVQGVYLHVLVSLLSSSSVTISVIIQHYFGCRLADPMFSLALCIAVWPLGVGNLFHSTLLILLQRQPKELDEQIRFALRELEATQDVKVQQSHFWTVNVHHARGALRVLARTEPEQLHKQMDLLGVRMTTEVEIAV